MELISMTDFALKAISDDRTCDRGLILDEMYNYARFLKQPLEISMFIPCDESGDVLEEKKGFLVSQEMQYDLYKQKVERAQEKVIFEGFDPDMFKKVPKGWLFISSKFSSAWLISDRTIGDMANGNTKFELKDSVREKFGF